MKPDSQRRKRLVADVGGTNTRIALFDPVEGSLGELSNYTNREHSSLEDIIAAWLEGLKQEKPVECCIAAAAPPSGDRVFMINIDWSFSCRELASQFGFERVGWLNDFQANAHALPHLKPEDAVLIHEGDPGSDGKLAVVGPGTGLGGSTLEWVNGTPIASDGEPGHMGLAPATDLELEILRLLLPRHGEIHTEFLVSGAGLVRLYQAIAEINGESPAQLSPAQVSAKGLAGTDTTCATALDTFCGLLGSACGDFVLARGAYGGLFLAGGILPRMVSFLQGSSFKQRFQQKGAMVEHLQRIPIKLITLPNPGLLGATRAPM